MSTSFALAGVTAVLEYLLNNGLGVPTVTGATGQIVSVTAMAPDLIDLTVSNAKAQLNLFLHQVSPNASWRNRGLASRSAEGDRIANQPLGIDLHYFLTAYGTADLEAEALLGYALQVLHETPVLSRDIIRTALNGGGVSTTSTAYQNPLKVTGLADQVEQLKISPFPLNTEEMSRFWTAMQAHYRPTFSFQVTVVLIQAQKSASVPLPVLVRNVSAQTGLTPDVPTIASLSMPNARTAALFGDTVTVSGVSLSDASPQILLTNDKYGINKIFSASGPSSDTQLQFTLPAPSSDWPVGLYRVTVILKAGTKFEIATNRLPFILAPNITTALPMTVATVGGTAVISISCDPQVLQEQTVSLILGGYEVPADTLTSNTPSLSFTAKVPPATYLARLRVDGIDSFILDYTVSPPVFLNKTITVT